MSDVPVLITKRGSPPASRTPRRKARTREVALEDLCAISAPEKVNSSFAPDAASLMQSSRAAVSNLGSTAGLSLGERRNPMCNDAVPNAPSRSVTRDSSDGVRRWNCRSGRFWFCSRQNVSTARHSSTAASAGNLPAPAECEKGYRKATCRCNRPLYPIVIRSHRLGSPMIQ